eukprot:12408189-Karenia_brevis.AAC.1
MQQCAKISAKRSAIAELEHSASELVLTRRCGDVSNFVYWLRCYGDVIGQDPAEQFDKDLRTALESMSGGPLPDTAWWQSSLGVKSGGLGLRSARDVALPAFIGSRVSSRPMVNAMFEHIESAGLGMASSLLAAYDRRTAQAIDALRGTLPTEAHAELRDIVADGGRTALHRWDTLRGTSSEQSDEQSGALAVGLVLDAGAEDDEHPDYQRGPRVQRQLSNLVDDCILAGLRDHFSNAGS